MRLRACTSSLDVLLSSLQPTSHASYRPPRRLVRAKKRVSVYEEPNCLVIHLKRFDAFALGGKVRGGWGEGFCKWRCLVVLQRS